MIDYKGLDIHKIVSGTPIYPEGTNTAYFEYDGDVVEGGDVQVITKATYDTHKKAIENQPKPVTPEDRIQQLEEQNLSLMLALAELDSAREQDKIETQLAIAELAMFVTETGGVA